MAARGAEGCEAGFGGIDGFGVLATVVGLEALGTTAGLAAITATVRLAVIAAFVGVGAAIGNIEFAMMGATIGLTTVDSGAGAVVGAFGAEAPVLG